MLPTHVGHLEPATVVGLIPTSLSSDAKGSTCRLLKHAETMTKPRKNNERGRDLTVQNTNDLFSWQIKDRWCTDLPFISFFLPFSVPSGMVEQQQPICCASALSKQTAPLWMQMSRRYSLLGPVETRRSPHCSLSFSPAFQSSAMKHEPCGHRVKILAKQQN